jgi:hypothetical protein
MAASRRISEEFMVDSSWIVAASRNYQAKINVLI